MFEALTGAAPLKGRNALETIFQRVTYVVAPSIKDVSPQLNFPNTLDAIVGKALKRDPEDRFGSVGELLQALEDFSENN
jgi:serine/threonine protein kinase